MANKVLYIFAEGPDDTIFFDTIIRPFLEKDYRMIPPVIEYAKKKKEKIRNRIKAIKEMNDDYLFFSDFLLILTLTFVFLSIFSLIFSGISFGLIPSI